MAGSLMGADDDDDELAAALSIDLKEEHGFAIKTRVGDDFVDSSSDDSQDVYEEIKPMDTKGVRKAVRRWVQTSSTKD